MAADTGFAGKAVGTAFLGAGHPGVEPRKLKSQHRFARAICGR
jgi:hypothetical protein